MKLYDLLTLLDYNQNIFIVTKYESNKPGPIDTFFNGKIKDIPVKKLNYYSKGSILKPINITSYDDYPELEITLSIDENEQF